MTNVADTDLEGCIKELAKRVRHELVGKTPLEVDEYFLCRSIEHLVRMDSHDAPSVVANIEFYRHDRHRGGTDRQRATFDALPFMQDALPLPRFRE